MTEAQLIHEGWFLWSAPTVYIGTQWSYEDKQAMRRQRVPILPVNRIPPLSCKGLAGDKPIPADYIQGVHLDSTKT